MFTGEKSIVEKEKREQKLTGKMAILMKKTDFIYIFPQVSDTLISISVFKNSLICLPV